MNKDQVTGRVQQTKGKAKEVVGKVVGDKDMEIKGKVEKTGGKIKTGLGDLKADIKRGT